VVHLYWRSNLCQVFSIPLRTSFQAWIPNDSSQGTDAGDSCRTVVLATGWTGSGNFINPMSGSGTLAIEAALIGLDRVRFIEKQLWVYASKGFDESSWKVLRRKTRAGAKDRLNEGLLLQISVNRL